MNRYTQKRLIALLLMVLLVCLSGAAVGTDEASIPPLRVTEVMASNSITLEDALGKSPDWIELHNEGSEPVALDGFALSDKKKELEKFIFPAEAVIQPDEYIIIFASGKEREITDTDEYHAPFKLSATGEAVYLSKDGLLIDSVLFGPQEKDISFALDSDGEYRQTLTPTPGAANRITAVPHE